MTASADHNAWPAARGNAFLIWVACCNFVTVGAATYLFWDQAIPIRILSAIAALAVGLIAAFGIPSLAGWADAASTRERVPTAAKRERPVEPRRNDEQLAAQLAIGTGLRARLQQAISDGAPNGTAALLLEIDGWIDETHALLDPTPDLARYFATDNPDTAGTNWPPKLQDAINLSQAGRLDRHLERLTEITQRR